MVRHCRNFDCLREVGGLDGLGFILGKNVNLGLKKIMPSLAVLKTLLKEVLTSHSIERTPEPDLVMDDPDQVAAYVRAGREDGVMAPVYLFHCAQICEVIRPGDTVLDLACGPATQLAMVARLNPEVRFIGADLSVEMLDRAAAYIKEQGLDNVELKKSDISSLSWVEARSVDAVFSTMALHHLPDGDALDRTFAEVARILKPGGGVYLVDFGRLKREDSIDYFAHQYADRQPELFTTDYLNSLKAAFSLADFRRVWEAHLRNAARLHSTFMMPYMVAVKSHPRREKQESVATALSELRAQLPPHHRTDLKDLMAFFRLGGLRSTLFHASLS